MTFVTEMISKEDQERVGALHLEQLYGKYGHPYKWTVDRQRDIYLLEGQRDRDEPQIVPILFGWKGQQFGFKAEGKDARAIVGGFDWSWRLTSGFTTGVFRYRTAVELPPEALVDLREALTAHSGYINPVHSISFDF